MLPLLCRLARSTCGQAIRPTCRRLSLAAVIALFVGALTAAPASAAGADTFYQYSGQTPLVDIPPGTVLNSRVIPFHFVGISTPINVVQLLYRSTSQLGAPTVNVTSVFQSAWHLGVRKLVAYQSFYDSTNPADEPSKAIAGESPAGGLVADSETTAILPFLLSGYDIVVTDTEGQNADFGAGPEYGMNTLDGIRAALASPLTGLPRNTKVGMYGYSGGAIATEWAAELAPTYAPDLSGNLVGAALGGVLVDPAHNLQYVSGSWLWASVMPMALVGITRSFGVDFTPYLSDSGRQVFAQMQKTSIVGVLKKYPGLTWSELALPQYPTPESIPVYVEMVNRLIMGTGGTPQIPMMFGQAANGPIEGTQPSPVYGAGDGIMIAGDVRSLARQYCALGVNVHYSQYPLLGHFDAFPRWIAEAVPWLLSSLNGWPAWSNCATMAPGNPLTPLSPN
jgi:hypothetical protein